MTPDEKTERLEFRCSASTKALIKEAARICDVTMTDWVINVCRMMAKEAIGQHIKIMGAIKNG